MVGDYVAQIALGTVPHPLQLASVSFLEENTPFLQKKKDAIKQHLSWTFRKLLFNRHFIAGSPNCPHKTCKDEHSKGFVDSEFVWKPTLIVMHVSIYILYIGVV